MHTYSVCMATMGGQSPSPALKLCRQHAGWSSNILAWVILHKETIPFPQVVMSFPDPQNMELQPCPHRCSVIVTWLSYLNILLHPTQYRTDQLIGACAYHLHQQENMHLFYVCTYW